ncbi:MAG: ABC transporter ATP-binding protein [Helicobacter sp.]|nr:ABC transporter ATP-binding protein [Helicobacter sp.]
MQLFHISHLNYHYGSEEILHDINLEYDNQDFLAIIGPNGGGKSTLMKIILSLLPTKNAIFLDHIQQKDMGYVPQNTLANPNFPIRVLDVVLMGLINQKIWGFYTKKDRQKALQILQKVGMQDYWDKRMDTLSGGQRQRVFIARALVSKSKLMLLDEPTASLDSKSAIQIYELLNTLHGEGVGIITICHDINLVLAYCNKIAYLNKQLFLHENTKEQSKTDFLKHLENHHHHFCSVEMSLKECPCERHEHG